MLQFFKQGTAKIYAVVTDHRLQPDELDKLSWAFPGLDRWPRPLLRAPLWGPAAK